jgi:hypothetical protein
MCEPVGSQRATCKHEKATYWMLGVIRLKQRLPRTPDRSYPNPQPLCGLWARKLIFVPFTGICLKVQFYTVVDYDS